VPRPRPDGCCRPFRAAGLGTLGSRPIIGRKPETRVGDFQRIVMRRHLAQHFRERQRLIGPLVRFQRLLDRIRRAPKLDQHGRVAD
jgi:hypothetical protein